MIVLCKEVMSYCAGKTARPFFYALGNEEYTTVLYELSCSEYEIVRASTFCSGKDKFPDIDRIIERLSANPQKLKLAYGLGEFLALKGGNFTAKTLSRLKDIPARAVLLLKRINPQIRNMAGNDKRLSDQGLFYVSNDFCDDTAVISSGHSGEKGIKSLLESLEEGKSGELFTDTSLDLGDSLLKVWESSYDALNEYYGSIDIPREAGSQAQWDMLLSDYVSHGCELQRVFASHGIFQGAKFPDDDYER